MPASIESLHVGNSSTFVHFEITIDYVTNLLGQYRRNTEQRDMQKTTNVRTGKRQGTSSGTIPDRRGVTLNGNGRWRLE